MLPTSSWDRSWEASRRPNIAQQDGCNTPYFRPTWRFRWGHPHTNEMVSTSLLPIMAISLGISSQQRDVADVVLVSLLPNMAISLGTPHKDEMLPASAAVWAPETSYAAQDSSCPMP